MSLRRSLTGAILGLAILPTLSSCGYNAIQAQDEAVKASWSDVLNQYQRRSDLIPNLVNTVKGYAKQEQDVFVKVTEARAKATSVNVSAADLSDPEKVKKFQEAQAQLSGSLGRLLVVSENYPQLKSDQNFRDLQAQLEGTENRITTSRNRFIESIQTYNTLIRSFPQNLTAKMFGAKEKANFTVEDEAKVSKAPTVDFNAK